MRPTPHPIDVRRAGGGYDAFLSYAWDPAEGRAGPAVPDAVSDAVVARRLRFAMQDLGKPRTRRTDLAIFLDRSVQTPSPDLWRGILDNLDRSRFLIVLCSPRSAASDGVAREAQHWLDTGRSLDDLLVVLLSGSAAEALPPRAVCIVVSYKGKPNPARKPRPGQLALTACWLEGLPMPTRGYETVLLIRDVPPDARHFAEEAA